ncbi:MAG: FAD-binding oxidoreductase [Desulfobacterota bacterium]|nr:FAD-binding oxidoreductase [Thermodesulfobacteriota bacterium]
MSLSSDLQAYFGSEAVSTDPLVLDAYRQDQSFVKPRRPDAVVKVKDVTQIQELIRYANKTLIPVIPFSSGLNLHGGTIPTQGGIVIDMSGMNRILMIDDKNWSAVIEPGVTAQQLQDELSRHNLRALLPFGIHPRRSALTSFVERDPAVAAASFEYGNEHIMDTELVLPTGELFRTGLWSAGEKPGSPLGPVRAMLNRLWTGAQGTLGIFTKINIKVEYLPMQRMVRLFHFDAFPEIIEPLRVMQRREIGWECFVINNVNAAALFCESWMVPEQLPTDLRDASEFYALRKALPPWLLVVCMNGGPRLPEEKLAYEVAALDEVARQTGMSRYENDVYEDLLCREMIRPWGILKKFCYRGAVHDVSFKTTLRRVPEFQRILLEVLNRYGYPFDDVGVYILIMERGRAVHCEIDIHGGIPGTEDAERIYQLWLEISERFIDEGAFFDRPYGAWAPLVYSRAGTYTEKLKQIKKSLDPNNIMNPGKLCF